MSEPTVKYKETLRGLDGMQAVYAFIVVLGLRELFLGFYDFFRNIAFYDRPADGYGTLLIFVFINIVLLALRMFWVPRNMRRLAFDVIRAGGGRPEAIYNSEVSIHSLIIVIHGMLIFLICAEFSNVAFYMTAASFAAADAFLPVAKLQAILLLTNAVWIALIALRKRWSLARANQPDKLSLLGWAVNNLVSAGVVFAILLAAEHAFLPGTSRTILGVPLETLHWVIWPIGWFHHGVAALGVEVEIFQMHLYVVWTVFLLNSGFDLLSFGRQYLVLEDVEWERVEKQAGDDP
ncbi:MAG: hypothetical protein AAF568_02905 [Pseudomonadota bacterium]